MPTVIPANCSKYLPPGSLSNQTTVKLLNLISHKKQSRPNHANYSVYVVLQVLQLLLDQSDPYFTLFTQHDDTKMF